MSLSRVVFAAPARQALRVSGWNCPREGRNCKRQPGEAARSVLARARTGVGRNWRHVRRTFAFCRGKGSHSRSCVTGNQGVPESLKLISKSLCDARKFYAPKATAIWSQVFYQYANRLAHHYFLTEVNDVKSVLVFLYFLNANDMPDPASESEWDGAVRLIHAAAGATEGPHALWRVRCVFGCETAAIVAHDSARR